MAAESGGKAGEIYAAAILEKQGYRILERNFHSRYGEVDIIAEKDGVIAFVEVKTRRRGAMVTGGESVGKAKQKKIITTALLYLQDRPELDFQPRFDLFGVITGPGGHILEYDHLEGAFDGEAYHT